MKSFWKIFLNFELWTGVHSLIECLTHSLMVKFAILPTKNTSLIWLLLLYKYIFLFITKELFNNHFSLLLILILSRIWKWRKPAKIKVRNKPGNRVSNHIYINRKVRTFWKGLIFYTRVSPWLSPGSKMVCFISKIYFLV